MQEQIETLLEKIKTDYLNWSTAHGKKPVSSYTQGVLDNWSETTKVKYGQKYVKIIRDNSVWGFIVNTDNDKVFKKGDILKAAGWNAPARNAARGNIFDDDYYINWTGPLYLR